MRRIYHPFWLWEDIGMWRDVSAREREALLEIAISFTGDAEQYGSAMMSVLDAFPIACEHNLTERGMNRRAWVGHAAAYLAHDLPEYITRDAWALLTQEQRDAADAKAEEAIHEWERRTAASSGSLYTELASEGISRRHA